MKPDTERVVSMVQFNGEILVATEYHVYRVVGEKLVEIPFESAKGEA